MSELGKFSPQHRSGLDAGDTDSVDLTPENHGPHRMNGKQTVLFNGTILSYCGLSQLLLCAVLRACACVLECVSVCGFMYVCVSVCVCVRSCGRLRECVCLQMQLFKCRQFHTIIAPLQAKSILFTQIVSLPASIIFSSHEQWLRFPMQHTHAAVGSCFPHVGW